LNLSVEDLNDSTPHFLLLKLTGQRTSAYQARQFQVEIEKASQREDWVRTRWLAYILSLPYMPKGKAFKPTDLVVFEWEKKEQDVDRKNLKRLKEKYG
jgi:hypothetical protein